MAGLQGVLLRTSIVLGMVVAVVTILYLQPVPGELESSTVLREFALNRGDISIIMKAVGY